MNNYKGLVFIKHGAVGTKMEGPVYFLQTQHHEYLLQYSDRQPWQPDKELELYCRKMVEIEGELQDKTLKVKGIKPISVQLIPKEEPKA